MNLICSLAGFYSINSFCLLPETPTLLQSVPHIWQYLQTFSIRIASSKRTKVHGRPLVESCHGDSQCQASINVGFVSPWCAHITQTWSSLTQLKTAVKKMQTQSFIRVHQLKSLWSKLKFVKSLLWNRPLLQTLLLFSLGFWLTSGSAIVDTFIISENKHRQKKKRCF